MKKIISFFSNLFCEEKPFMSPKEAVKHSVKKYNKAYKLLEKYEKTGSDASPLANSGVVGRYFK